MEAPDFEMQFAVWQSCNYSGGALSLVNARGNILELSMKGGLMKTTLLCNGDGSFFIEQSSDDAGVSDLNAWLCEGPKEFGAVLDRLSSFALKKKKPTLADSFGSLGESGSQHGSLGYSGEFDDEDDESGKWCIGDDEKALLMRQVGDSGFEISVNDDLASIVLTFDPKDFLVGEWSSKFGLSQDENILVSLLYNTPVSPIVRVSQYKTTADSEGLIMLRSMVEHFFTTLRISGDVSDLRPLPYTLETGKVEKTGGDSVKSLFMSSGVVKNCDEKHVTYLQSMGFTKGQSIRALTNHKNNVDAAIEFLVSNPATEMNVFVELKEYLTDRFVSPSSYCLACHSPHRCGGALPIICGRDLCVFYFEERLGMRCDCRLCPMEDCNSGSGIDSSLALCQALQSSGGAFGISLSTLLEMHRHRYLPIGELLKLHEAISAVNYQIVEIESILNPSLCARFEHKWKEMKTMRDGSGIDVVPVLGYHGTAQANVEKIKQNGLLVPGKNYPGIGVIGHATDNGWYGKGIYLSPNASVSIGYCRGGSILLVNAVLMGKIFKCTTQINGAPLKAGYDSHQDPSGNEFVIFDECQVLPCYAIKIAPKNQHPVAVAK